MNYVKKILSNPLLYYIPLPKNSIEIYLEINLKSGYSSENKKEVGLGHLLEHYLTGRFSKSEKLKKLQIGASVTRDTTNYYLKSTKPKLLKEAEAFLDNILTPDFSNNELFQTEKASLINELKGKLNSFYERSFDLVLKERFKNNCPYKVGKSEQIKNVKQKTLEDLKRYYKKTFTSSNILFTIAGYKLDNKILKEISSLIESYPISENKLGHSKIRCLYSQFKIKAIKDPSIVEEIALAITFPSLTSQAKTKERVELDIIGELLSSSEIGIQNELRAMGIYDLDYQRLTWKNAGIFGFFTTLPQNKLISFLTFFNKNIRETKKSCLSKKKLQTLLLEEKKTHREAFMDNIQRLEWLTYDLITWGKPISFKEDLEEIKKITPESIKKTANRFLNTKMANIIIIAKKPKKIDLPKIKSLFF